MKGLNLKPKHKTYIALGVIAITVGYIIYNRNKKRKQIKLIQDTIQGNVASQSVPATLKKEEVAVLPMGQFPLKLGDKNQLVFNLQQGLNKNYNAGIVQDGKYGESTARALCKSIWRSCFTDVQARNYTVSNTDYNKALKINS
jgi:hypothetical protein